MSVVTELTWRENAKFKQHDLLSPCIRDGVAYPWHIRLGIIKQRHDGRFDWFRLPINELWAARIGWLVSEAQQGVAVTLEEAKRLVELGFQTPTGKLNN